MEKANKTIRKKIEDAGFAYWQVADEIGITAGTFSVWLRTPLNEERKARTEQAIKKLKEKK